MISVPLLGEPVAWIGWALYAPLVLFAIWRTPWIELFSDLRRQHLLFGSFNRSRYLQAPWKQAGR